MIISVHCVTLRHQKSKVWPHFKLQLPVVAPHSSSTEKKFWRNSPIGGNSHTFCTLWVNLTKWTSPQSHLRKARRSSAYKKNSKLLDPHSPIKSRSSPRLLSLTALTAPVPCAAANGGLLIMAAEKPQFSCIFAREFRVNPKFDLQPVYVIRKGISRWI